MAVAVYSLQEVVIIDATASNGTLTLTQESGSAATFSEISSKVFRIVRMAGRADIISFKLSCKADGPEIYRIFEVAPVGLLAELVLTDTDATDFDNWR